MRKMEELGGSEWDVSPTKCLSVKIDDLSNKEKSQLNDSGSQNKEQISVI